MTRTSRLLSTLVTTSLLPALALSLSLGMLGCSAEDGGGGDSPVTTVLKSHKARLTAPGASNQDVEAVAAGNNAFALDLMTLLDKDKNILFSPYSISLALAMTWGGAQTDTEKQMGQVMHYGLSQAKMHPAMNTLDLALESRGEGKKGQDGGAFRLRIANAIWGQKGYPFLDSYLDLLALNYGAGLNILDFITDPEKCRQTINDWVENKTEDKIVDLIPKGALSADTRLVLTNAVYFNAAWAEPFEESATKNAPFYKLDGNEVQVPTMRGTSAMKLAEGKGWQAVAVPYDGGELDMVILLPKGQKLDGLSAQLDAKMLGGIFKELKFSQVDLSLPRFGYTANTALTKLLKELGMTLPFVPGKADFSGLDGSKKLFISEVLHKAFIKVNEAGTEAAAATAVIMNETSIAPDPVSVKVDQPFIYLIRDVKTSTVLFFGRVVDPAS